MISTAPNLTLPPLGDPEKADKYVSRLVRLIEQDKVNIVHTDLNKFDLSSMQNHYRIELGEYDVEISHSIQPETDKDFYTMIFNSIKKVQNGSSNKIILAYIHLNDEQYKRFKIAADEGLERQKRKEDAVRFVEVMKPLDNLLEELDPASVMPAEGSEKSSSFFSDPESPLDEGLEPPTQNPFSSTKN